MAASIATLSASDGAGGALTGHEAGAAFASWAFPAMFIIGALTDRPDDLCKCHIAPPRPELFPLLILTLFFGALDVDLLASRPAEIRIVRARALARKRPESGRSDPG